MRPLYQEMFHQLTLTTRPFETQLNEQLMEYHIHRTEWAILYYLMLDEHIRLVEIGRLLGMDKPNVTRTIKRLVELDYIELSPSQSDGRKKNIKVTEKGYTLFHTLRASINVFELELLEGVSEEEQRSMYSTLKTIQQNLIKRAGEQLSE
ncbi:MarR family transcriptional regulator [Bacillus sp. Bva_UNVM-123]|uniref:MarR family winged helix-turn-helix transcriptional regulator n=1 Tax=Bacillus sp. Bva_UNVM-123 TaxID=2829798 RepID=UPI00391FA7F3